MTRWTFHYDDDGRPSWRTAAIIVAVLAAVVIVAVTR